MKFLALFALLFSLIFVSAADVRAQTAAVSHPDDVAPIAVSPGVILKELTGRSAAGASKSDKCSVALFRLEPGRASAWSYNKVGEESFFVLEGHGEIWLGNRAQAVRPGSFVLVPPSVVRSVRASGKEALVFYAVTAPAWSQEDDVLTDAPAGAPK